MPWSAIAACAKNTGTSGSRSARPARGSILGITSASSGISASVSWAIDWSAAARSTRESSQVSPLATVGSMRLATWNVNSIKQRVPRLLPWLDERRPDVVCLQETKVSDEAFAELLGDELASRGYSAAVHGQVTWNGVAILSRVGLEDVIPGLDEA